MLTTRSGRRASQNEFELNSFIALLAARDVRNYCEIGARHGDTFFSVVTSLPIGSRGVAVDLPGGLWGTYKSQQSLEQACAELREMGYVIDLVLGDSQQVETQQQIAQHGRFGAMLIDGDHTLQGVTNDWNLYRDMAPLIAFHDIVGTGQVERVGGRPVEVPIFWDSIKKDFEHREFVDADSKMGIGVLLCAE